MISDEWGWERIGAVSFVTGTAALGCCLWCFSSLACCVWKSTCGCFIGKFLNGPVWILVSIGFAAAYGFVLALWAHWVPCFWLSCDLGAGDDADLRGALLWAGWPVASLMYLVLFCARGSVCGMRRNERKHSRLQASGRA